MQRSNSSYLSEENLLVNLTTLCAVGPQGRLEPDTGAPPGLTLYTSHLCVMDSLYTRQNVAAGYAQGFLFLSFFLASDYHYGELALLPLVLSENILGKKSACFCLSHMSTL